MGRVLIRKSDGIPIEYQSTGGKLGVLMKNAVNSGLNINDYTEQYMTDSEYESLEEVKINKPKRDFQKNKKNLAITSIREKLGLTKKEFDTLKEALK